MNVVIYARFSSHSQTEQSIEGQLGVCYDFAQKQGYTIIAEYIDRAISGTNAENRPEFQRMIEDSSKKQFEGVLVYQLDRFARNRYDSATYKARLKKNGVRVYSAKENITDDASGILVEGLLESMAEYYSAELSQKIRRGMDLNASKCLCTGGNIALGFKVAPDKTFLIDENTAPLVQEIFRRYADGETVVEICDSFNARGLKTSRGVPFNKNSLRLMLQNKRYIGTYTYRDMEIEHGMPRIIEDELFNAVQEKMVKNKKAPAHSKAEQEYILTTKLFCGLCREMMTGIKGNSHTGKPYYYYKCNHAKKKLCSKKAVRKEYIEDLVIAQCRKLLSVSNIEKIARAVVETCERDKDKSRLRALRKQLENAERKQNNLTAAIIECDIESVRKSLYEQVPILEQEKKAIEAEIALENIKGINITVPQIKFFLQELKKGNVKSLKYRKTLVNVFVNSDLVQ